MWRKKSAAWSIAAASIVAAFGLAPGRAAAEHKIVMNGRCHYTDRVARHRDDTTLILCDTATITNARGGTTLDFGQRSWGSMARFMGVMAGNRMTVSGLSLRGGEPIAATGTCELVHLDDGTLSAISCLAKAGSRPRPVAANFLPSRL